MVENLKTTKFNDGSPIPLITDNTLWKNALGPGYCWYDNDIANKNQKGGLYNYYAVKTGKLAPVGWHVATDTDWTLLQNYLIANGYNYDGTTIDNKIGKALASISGWPTTSTQGAVGNNQASNNKSGFTAYPSGQRFTDASFVLKTSRTSFWISDLNGNSISCYGLDYNGNSPFYFDALLAVNGFSVRCIKDL